MRTTINHQAPKNTQPEPEDNASDLVMRQVRAWQAASEVPAELARPYGLPLVIHTQSAMEIAAWWQAPGNAFTSFASTGTILDGLADDIAEELRSTGPLLSDSLSALRALDAYVRACTLPAVWTVGNNVAGYLPEGLVQSFIDYADAVSAFREMVKEAPDVMTEDSGAGDCSADGPCDITVDSIEECEYHDLDATVRSYLADEVPTADGALGVFSDPRELLLYLRPDSVPLPTAYWLSLVTFGVTYGDYLSERDA